MPRTGLAEALGEENLFPEMEDVRVVDHTQVAETKQAEESAKESEEEPASEGETPAEPSGLADQLRQFGVKEVPSPEELENLPPQIQDLVKSTIATGLERVKGIQSGVTKSAQELAAEKRALGEDAELARGLKEMPEFRWFIEQYQSGKLKDYIEPEEEIDISALPEDPLERFKALSKASTKKDLDELRRNYEQLREELDKERRTATAREEWREFTSQHADAVEGAAEIADYVSQGFSLEKAYKAWKLDNFDPEAEVEARLAERAAALESKKQGNAVAKVGSPRDADPKTDEEPVEDESRVEVLERLFANAEKDLGITL